ncbi:signal peptidase I [Bryocella elongata]|uniref:Signal peptidase I n=1 Tax=Bryocella elongata TaxID=863522 RepID=A0A1H5SYE8_9BACT|nr:signal peptidase I [Bryocella elongata]SEF55484.1 signal peptidase I [Bryocella elongata]
MNQNALQQDTMQDSTEGSAGTMAEQPVGEESRGDGVHEESIQDVVRAQSSGWRAWARDLVIAVAISVFIILFLYQPVRVEGTSMLPVLEDQDRLFINKFAYRFDSIHRGDVVVFLYPNDHTKSYIKRVIALPGDDLRIDHGKVFVNGVMLKEPYVPSRYADDRSQPEMTVAPHEYFVMGDHRLISSDSRDFGTVPRDLIYGRAAFVYWPVDQAGIVR